MPTKTETKLWSDVAASASTGIEASTPIGRVFAARGTVPTRGEESYAWL